MGLAEMEGFFENLAMAVKSERATLNELVKSNSVLTTTNNCLTQRVSTLEKDLKEAQNKGDKGGGGG